MFDGGKEPVDSGDKYRLARLIIEPNGLKTMNQANPALVMFSSWFCGLQMETWSVAEHDWVVTGTN